MDAGCGRAGAAKVVGVDLLAADPVAGAVMLQGDFSDPAVQERLVRELGGKADLVLSDMAPNTTGHAATDHLRIVALAEAALEFALEVLAEGGGFVAKVFQGGAREVRAGAAATALRLGPPRQTAGESEGIQRTLCGGDPLSRHSRLSGNPSRSSARSTLMSTAKPFLSGSRSFSGCTSRRQTSSYCGPDFTIRAVP